MTDTDFYTRTFHPNYVGILATVILVLALVAVAILLVRRFR